jgi:glycerol transport system ATP-binding protein
MAEIKLENITHIYSKDVVAVKDVNWVIESGVAAGLLGPSGCGKTTLMKVIAGILRPTKGRVYFNGEDVTDSPIEKRNIGMVFQFPVVYHMTVYDNLAFPLRNIGYPVVEIKRRIKEISQLLELESVLHFNAYELDPGAKQKVALGRAIIRGEMNAIILDEPLTNIPPEGRMKLRLVIKNVRKVYKTTMIFVTHDQSEAFTMSEKVAIMKDGQILQYDTQDAIYDKPKNTFIAHFVGHPGMNLLLCDLMEDRLDFGDFQVKDKDVVGLIKNVKKLTGDSKTSRIYFGIRPEHVKVDNNERPGWIEFKCIGSEFSENKQILLLKKESTEIQVTTHRFDIKEGDTLYVYFPHEKVRFFDLNGNLIF